MESALPRVLRVYRAIHEKPERGHEQPETRDLLIGQLTEIGFTEFEVSVKVPTAVIAVLDSHRVGPTVVLRAEMDALKLQEAESHDPRSKRDGVMHACGHDAHAAMLLGAAQVLFEHREHLHGRVVFLFQPAEEVKGGADELVEEGLLGRLGVRAIFAQHVAPGQRVGTVNLGQGCVMAGSSTFTIRVEGKGSHAAAPFEGSDVPAVVARIASGIVDLPARHLDLLSRPAVISVTSIEVGTSDSTNILPTSGVIKGTIRAFEKVQQEPTPGAASIKNLIADFANTTAGVSGATARVEIIAGSPPNCNDSSLFDQVHKSLATYWSGDIAFGSDRTMYSEDFAYYALQVPALYFGLGIARDDQGWANVHTADFTVHQDALTYGVRLLVALARMVSDGTLLGPKA